MTPIDTGKPAAVIAVAASAGGVEALNAFVAALPAGFAGAVLVVLHISSAGPSVLPAILSRSGRLPARHPADGEELAAGVILVAPPDRHLAVSGSTVRVTAGPRENGHRPAADVLLRSVATHWGERAAGVVLSGTMDDGAAGLRAVRVAGGLSLVQDPTEAAFPGMPLAAIAEADPQVIARIGPITDKLCEWLAELPAKAAEPGLAADKDSKSRASPDTGDLVGEADVTSLTCPECGGTLWRRNEDGAERFRCRVGHTYSADSLLIGKQTALESALWAAIVALEERAEVARRIARRLQDTGRASQLARYRHDVAEAEKRADILRRLMDDLVQ